MLNFNPFIELLLNIASLYKFVLIVWFVLVSLIRFGIVNAYQPLVARIVDVLGRLVEPVLSYLRRYIPTVGGIDFSPVVLFLSIDFFKSILINYFYR